MKKHGYLKLINLTKELLRAGEHEKAKLVAEHMIAKHPAVLNGWLFMVGLCPPHERIVYLSRALEIAPDDPTVKKAAAWVHDQIPVSPPTFDADKFIIEDSDQITKKIQLLRIPEEKQQKSIHFLLISIFFALIGFGAIFLYVYWFGPTRPQSNVSEETLQLFQTKVVPIPSSTPTQEPVEITITPTLISETTPTETQTPSPTPTPEWMTYDGIDFRNQEVEILIDMACGQDQVYLSPFTVVPYSPDIVESGRFVFVLDFSIAWEHLGFYGLFIHSGRSIHLGDLPAFPLQLYMENDHQGYRRNPVDFDQHLQDCIMDSTLRLRQGDTISLNRVVAAVRVPPSGVDEVSRHPMEMVPYLAKNYPNFGFEDMEPPGLLFYFCGRHLRGEAFNRNYDHWTQSRIIIGFTPIDED